jgi:hypothetical protein
MNLKKYLNARNILRQKFQKAADEFNKQAIKGKMKRKRSDESND